MAVEYGVAPDVIDNIEVPFDEMIFHLYMPVFIPENPLPEDMDRLYRDLYYSLPPSLLDFRGMMATAILHETNVVGNNFTHWYITVKNMFVTPDNMANRPGWHSDGYMTEDVNYIWTNRIPSEFAVQEFVDLSPDHSVSLDEMEAQVRDESIVRYQENDLIRIDQRHIHRVPVDTYTGMRMFVKISASNHRFNLKGNAHNHQIGYDWRMYSRDELRNMESVKDNSDYVEDDE